MKDMFTDQTCQRLSFFHGGVPGVAHGAGVLPGILFAVPTEDLKTHCQKRSDYHYGRAKDKEKEIPRFEKLIKDLQAAETELKDASKAVKGLATPAARGNPSNIKAASAGYNFNAQSDSIDDQISHLEGQVEAIQQDVKDHTNRAAMFAWMSEHLFNGVYALSWEDLRLLELSK